MLSLRGLYERLGARYLLLFGAFEVVSAVVVCWATVGMFSLYVEMSFDEFWQITVFAEATVLVAIGWVIARSARLARPVIDWLQAGKPEDGALEAWRCGVALPRQVVEDTSWQPFVIVAAPNAVFLSLHLDLPVYSGLIVFAGVLIAVAYAALLHFFASEQFLKPVVSDMAERLPPDFAGSRAGVPLRWKMLAALPLINVVTGVVVSGLSTDGTASLEDLGLDVAVALLVSFTLSFELTLLVAKSVLGPVDDLLEATERVKRGSLDARVPLTSADEVGELAGSFNEMMQGLAEREALREAFGSYVDPEVAERVLEEGELIEAQEREVTVLFVDIRDFTSFAERSSPSQTVAFLTDFFELVVPIVKRRGGHANKFLGDGVLAVFGAPERLSDHAARAVRAAAEIVEAVEDRFGDDLRVGVGINSGSVVLGSVGGGGRLEFTVVGDPVNVAARVEAATRDTGDAVLLTEATRGRLPDPDAVVEPRGEVPLKGKSEPVPVYALSVPLDESTIPQTGHIKAEA
ncbi:MAG TPA: adenylate/guanylate cyclase domain-containing protein [Thermoleophilaceae bacterium]|nr:adenylate/guanylate cyclase domain-containing protein [Thermoleophilaceae bacterium]